MNKYLIVSVHQYIEDGKDCLLYDNSLVEADSREEAYNIWHNDNPDDEESHDWNTVLNIIDL